MGRSKLITTGVCNRITTCQHCGRQFLGRPGIVVKLFKMHLKTAHNEDLNFDKVCYISTNIYSSSMSKSNVSRKSMDVLKDFENERRKMKEEELNNKFFI
jgi:hypothetical protein